MRLEASRSPPPSTACAFRCRTTRSKWLPASRPSRRGSVAGRTRVTRSPLRSSSAAFSVSLTEKSEGTAPSVAAIRTEIAVVPPVPPWSLKLLVSTSLPNLRLRKWWTAARWALAPSGRKLYAEPGTLASTNRKKPSDSCGETSLQRSRWSGSPLTRISHPSWVTVIREGKRRRTARWTAALRRLSGKEPRDSSRDWVGDRVWVFASSPGGSESFCVVLVRNRVVAVGTDKACIDQVSMDVYLGDHEVLGAGFDGPSETLMVRDEPRRDRLEYLVKADAAFCYHRYAASLAAELLMWVRGPVFNAVETRHGN
ncbi:hypothetical protein N1851_033946 [Merluccius polli]|uniref:Uncharacterized protein n=1 Tax=Merluccius polli TaxID=89951 RepID=A0AA47M0G9_MERPO|nr:hypothetical protein N1851_033946 [Merluccius polli]